MGIHRVIMDAQAPNVSSSTVALTTAGTTVLIPSLSTALISAGSGSIYLTDLIWSCGPSQSSIMLGVGATATAPTTSAILINALFVSANNSMVNDLATPIKFPSNTNLLLTAVSNTTLNVTAIYYMGM